MAAELNEIRDADERMTAERDEVKYLVPARHVKTLAAGLSQCLPQHRFTGKGANLLPNPRHFVTTVYFDTPSRHQYRAACADSEHNLKMRAKEYYDLHPSLAELATDPRQIVKYQPVLWLELKFREGSKSGKRRIGIPKPEVPAFFQAGSITPEMIELQRATYGADSEAVLREIGGYCARYNEPMQADCLVNYRRIPWQDEAGMLRVTLDLGLEFYRPPADIWQRRYALVRESLGPAAGGSADAVLELKSHGPLPGWLNDLLRTVETRPARFSKFEAASMAIHGRLTT
ncbi:MAG TPA: VTC domain-containing protein [Polyangia bacterium]